MCCSRYYKFNNYAVVRSTFFLFCLFFSLTNDLKDTHNFDNPQLIMWVKQFFYSCWVKQERKTFLFPCLHFFLILVRKKYGIQCHSFQHFLFFCALSPETYTASFMSIIWKCLTEAWYSQESCASLYT